MVFTIYLYVSNFICEGYCNVSENYVTEEKGGGIYAIDSKIILGNESMIHCSNEYIMSTNPLINISLIFRHNSAINGGGMYLGENSNLIVPSNSKYRLTFEYNNANEDGAAMYIDDDTYHATCCESNIICTNVFTNIISVEARYYHDLQDSQTKVISNSTNLKTTIPPNLAPYKAKYRYWSGLLLFVRMVLYLGIATEKSHESVIIVLAIGLIAASILLLRTFLGNNIYRNRFIGYLNSSFSDYNLLALSLARLFCQNSSSCQKRSTIISFILSYHILGALLEIRRFRHLIASIEQKLNLRKLKIKDFKLLSG